MIAPAPPRYRRLSLAEPLKVTRFELGEDSALPLRRGGRHDWTDRRRAGARGTSAGVPRPRRWCESQPWSESYICQHFIGVRSSYKTCVRDDVLLRKPAEFVTAPPVHEEGQKRTFLTPLEFAAFLEASRKAGPVEHAAALMGLSGLRVAEMCSLRVESLTQDGGYDSLEFIRQGRQAGQHRWQSGEGGVQSVRLPLPSG